MAGGPRTPSPSKKRVKMEVSDDDAMDLATPSPSKKPKISATKIATSVDELSPEDRLIIDMKAASTFCPRLKETSR